ncbi:MAG: SH3 domain-containing protein [Chitinispirillaceae bacterium]
MFLPRKLNGLILTVSAVSLMYAGCGDSESDSEAKKPETRKQTEQAVQAQPKPEPEDIVCIWDGVAIRDTCSSKGKYLANISLGEVVKFLGETGIDPTNKKREYLKIQLSDGKSGWANGYCLARDARAAAVKEPAVIFKRPDVLTMTDKKLEPTEFVAISEEKDGFVQVVGEKRKKKGWVKKDFLVENKEEVAMAVFISKKLGNDFSDAEKLSQVIDLAPYPNSMFMSRIEKKLSDLKAAPEETSLATQQTEETEDIAEQENTETAAEEE